jgi:DNA integrity scanning protein DisA with diadenylate cyclase activity
MDMPDKTSQVLLAHIGAIAEACGASVVFLPLEAARAGPEGWRDRFSGRVLLMARESSMQGISDAAIVSLPDVPMTRMGQIKLATFLAISRGLVNAGDILAFLAGDLEGGITDTVFVTEVGRQSEILAHLPEASGLSRHIRPEVVARTIDIAIEIGSEGREGKPVGALFIIGDVERVLSLSRPLVLNPFHGYSEADRNILDPLLEETVKEFSAIDGAFIVRGDGVIEACGVFLKTATSDEHELPQGLGARHHVAAGITAVTDAVAISVSESTGTVTIFMGGHILTEVEKPRRVGRQVLLHEASPIMASSQDAGSHSRQRPAGPPHRGSAEGGSAAEFPPLSL